MSAHSAFTSSKSLMKTVEQFVKSEGVVLKFEGIRSVLLLTKDTSTAASPGFLLNITNWCKKQGLITFVIGVETKLLNVTSSYAGTMTVILTFNLSLSKLILSSFSDLIMKCHCFMMNSMKKKLSERVRNTSAINLIAKNTHYKTN